MLPSVNRASRLNLQRHQRISSSRDKEGVVRLFHVDHILCSLVFQLLLCTFIRLSQYSTACVRKVPLPRPDLPPQIPSCPECTLALPYKPPRVSQQYRSISNSISSQWVRLYQSRWWKRYAAILVGYPQYLHLSELLSADQTVAAFWLLFSGS